MGGILFFTRGSIPKIPTILYDIPLRFFTNESDRLANPCDFIFDKNNCNRLIVS